MTLPYLYMMNSTMLARLLVYMGDGPISRKRWGFMIVIPYLAACAFEPGINFWLLLALMSLINFLAIAGDSRIKNKELFRFAILVCFAIVYSIFFSPMIRLEFNPRFFDLLHGWANYSSLLTAVNPQGVEKASVILFGLLLASNEVNLLIRSCFRIFGLIPSGKPVKGEKYLLKPVDTQELNAGRLIGILERIIMVVLVLGGSIGSIGFVLAAKAFARFRELDQRPFAEYVLIGTLLSTLFAVLIGYGVKALLL
jgi:hypothetical protein